MNEFKFLMDLISFSKSTGIKWNQKDLYIFIYFKYCEFYLNWQEFELMNIDYHENSLKFRF